MGCVHGGERPANSVEMKKVVMMRVMMAVMESCKEGVVHLLVQPSVGGERL